MATNHATLPRPRVIEYQRVSRVGGRSGEGYISIDEQHRRNLATAEDRGLEIVLVLKDEDYSGGNLERPEFQRGLGLVRDEAYAGFVTATYDRFSRDEADSFTLLRQIEDAGGRLWCGDGDVSMRNSSEALQTGIRTIFNAFERRTKGEGLAAAKRAAIARGVHLQVPFGYRRANGRSSKLVVEPAEKALVVRIFERRAQGWSWRKIADEANALGPPPRAKRRKRDEQPVQGQWVPNTVRAVVLGRDGTGRRVYLGEAWNSVSAEPHVGAHPALVSHELWQRATETRGTTHARPTQAQDYLLTSLARCGRCGHPMHHNQQTITLADGSTSLKRYYRCRSDQVYRTGCRAPGVRADEVETFVLDAFRARYLDKRRYVLVEDDSGLQAARDELDRVLARLAYAQERELDAVGQGQAVLRSRQQQTATCEAAVREAEHALVAVQAKLRGHRLPGDLDAEGMRSAPVERQRHFLAAVFRCVVVAPDTQLAIGERCRILGVDQAPDGDALRDLIVRG